MRALPIDRAGMRPYTALVKRLIRAAFSGSRASVTSA
jgi:hypothetical protein